MTSVPNLRRPLSGSSAWAVIVALALTCACNPSRKLPTDTGTDRQQEEVTRVYNPVTGQYEAVKDPLSLVDTIDWQEVIDQPVISSAESATSGKKDRYALAFMLPLQANLHRGFGDEIPARTRRFLNYYAGMRLALADLTRRGIDLDVRVLDTEESTDVVRQQLRELRDVDLIVGPYDRDAIREAAEFGARYRIPVVSPWTPSITLEYPNQQLVQMVPGLRTHAAAAIEFIGQRFLNPRIYIVARDDRERSRFAGYHAAQAQYNPGLERVEELMIYDATVDLAKTNLDTLIHDTRPTVFILPYFSRNDEEFVGALLRKLHAEKLERNVTVFGLPQWINFSRLNPDYLESLQTHITAAQHVDWANEATRRFSKDFYDAYAGIPEPSGKQGYDLVMFLGESLKAHGVPFMEPVAGQPSPHGDILLRPVRDESARPDGDFPVLYYENQGIQVLQFTDQAYQIVH
ncbi:MAG: ABC transporter substrate-binding protein [Saprospiraceae bacterium]|nr:ABC transporter substrate-binding protein [Saprospiraceae bacterium]